MEKEGVLDPVDPLERIKNENVVMSKRGTARRISRLPSSTGSVNRKFENFFENIKTQLFLLLEVPESSDAAYVTQVFSMVFTVLSIIIMCLQTVDFGQEETKNSKFKTYDCELKYYLRITDRICTYFFMLEFGLRFFASQHKIKFLVNGFNIIDLLALIPVLLEVVLKNSKRSSTFLKMLRLVRAFRILRLCAHSESLRLLGRTIGSALTYGKVGES